MALIVDPDSLSQGALTSPSDAAWTSSSGTQTTITGAATLPSVTTGDYFEVRDHSVAGNNGLYQASGSPTTSSITCDKVDGVNPTDASAEAIRTFHTDASASTEKSVMIDTGQKRIYLLEQGNLSVDGVTLQALYSFLKEEWKTDADLIQFTFPIVSITPEQFEFSDGWEPRNVTSPAIQSKKLIRTAGWSEIDTNDITQAVYSGVITLGTFEDSVNDNAYYQLGLDPTDTTATTGFTFNGPVNEAILVYQDFGVPGDVVVTTNDTITSSGSDFVAAGFVVGGSVTISDAEDAGNDGTWELAAVTTTTLVVVGTPLTNNADDTTMRLAVDNQAAVKLFLRVRDGDTNGKTYDSATIAAIGFSSIDNKAFRYPLANGTDLNISETDANIGSNTPYTQIRIKYFDQAFSKDVDSATNRDFGIVVDVGTHSGVDGSAPGAASVLTSAEGGINDLGATFFNGGTLRIYEGGDEGTDFPIVSHTDTTITVTGTIASGSNLSFTAFPSSLVSASLQEIYEKVQYQLRQAADIDSTTNVVAGDTADELLEFVGADLRAGSFTPTNPNGGGSGVLIQGFDANDTNNLFFFDNTATSRNYPFVAAGTISFNANLVSDTDPEYWMFYEYTTRTVVSDFAISSASGSTASIDSAGANLPTVAQNDYIRLTDMSNSENNGIWVVTDATPTTSQFDARKVDGATVVNEGSAPHPVDQNPIDSPQAIIVDNNSGVDIAGAIGASSIGFDFDYDNNVQGGRTAATDAAIVIRAIGLETGQFAETSGTITRTTGLAFSVVSALERNYSNP